MPNHAEKAATVESQAQPATLTEALVNLARFMATHPDYEASYDGEALLLVAPDSSQITMRQHSWVPCVQELFEIVSPTEHRIAVPGMVEHECAKPKTWRMRLHDRNYGDPRETYKVLFWIFEQCIPYPEDVDAFSHGVDRGRINLAVVKAMPPSNYRSLASLANLIIDTLTWSKGARFGILYLRFVKG